MSARLLLLALPFALAATVAQAQEASAESSLTANIRRIGLEYSETTVHNAREYQNSPVAPLSADSQKMVKGVFDAALEYRRTNMQWTNSLFAEYGKTEIEPINQPSVKTENADKILFTSDYAHKLHEYNGLKFGPTVIAEYQTEFTADNGKPRSKVARLKAGYKAFDGTVVKDMYLVGVAEYDMTYPQHVQKSAAEAGWRIEGDLRDGVKLSTDGYYRRYLSYDRYIGTDLRYDFSANARMDVDFIGKFTFGPYINYRRAHSREARKYASNTVIGLSLTYKDLFKLF